MDENVRRDEELFDSLGKARKRKRRRLVTTIITVILVFGVAVAITVVKLRTKVRTQFADTVSGITSVQVKTGSISTTVSGTGTLTNVDIEKLSIPKGVDVDEVLVNVNETVENGQLIATVDSRTVLAAMADIQSQIEALDKKLNTAGSDYVNDYISTGVPGRVKKIYAAPGDDVAGVMYRDGALAVLSLDGYMAVDIDSDILKPGDRVSVIRADGSEMPGLVDDVNSGKAVVLVSDDGPMLDEQVSVKDVESKILGEGKLYIHVPLRITGVMGTIQLCYVVENQKLYNTGLLFTLIDTEYNNKYNSLLKDRRELEKTLQELLALNQNGGLTAPYAGTICSVDYEEKDEDKTASASASATTSAMPDIASAYSSFFGIGSAQSATTMPTTENTGNKENKKETDICTICPDVSMEITLDVDESHILTLEVGQEADVTISSISEEEVFNGKVTEISRTAVTSNSGVTRYNATITIDKNKKMLAGMSASVYIRIQGKDNALIIPIEALHQTSSTSFVYTSYDSEQQKFGGMVEIKTGLSNSSYAEVESGLKEGDTVYYTESLKSRFEAMSGMSTSGGYPVPPGGSISVSHGIPVGRG